MLTALKSGYSRKVVQDNLATLIRAGHARANAIRFAFNAARQSYFTKHPEGALPDWLAYPKGKRLKAHYMPNGAPLRDMPQEANPVRELDIAPDELEEIKSSIQKQLGGQGAAVRKAAALFTDFTGHKDVSLSKVGIPQMPVAVLAIGQVDGIMYSTVRDGIAEKYIHRFKSSARPLLTASPDGKQLYLIGGSYDFTERGIVDRKP